MRAPTWNSRWRSRRANGCRAARSAGVGVEKPGEEPHRRRLAGAVRAEEAVDDAGRDRQVEAGEGGPRAVACEAAGGQGEAVGGAGDRSVLVVRGAARRASSRPFLAGRRSSLGSAPRAAADPRSPPVPSSLLPEPVVGLVHLIAVRADLRSLQLVAHPGAADQEEDEEPEDRAVDE